MRLPRELRDEVYTHVLGTHDDDAIYVKPHPRHSGLRRRYYHTDCPMWRLRKDSPTSEEESWAYFDGTNEENREDDKSHGQSDDRSKQQKDGRKTKIAKIEPNIFLVSKTIHAEASKALYLGSTVSFPDPSTADAFLSPLCDLSRQKVKRAALTVHVSFARSMDTSIYCRIFERLARRQLRLDDLELCVHVSWVEFYAGGWIYMIQLLRTWAAKRAKIHVEVIGGPRNRSRHEESPWTGISLSTITEKAEKLLEMALKGEVSEYLFEDAGEEDSLRKVLVQAGMWSQIAESEWNDLDALIPFWWRF